MKYALIGAAGYIARKHVECIAATGGELVAACDLTDSVGYLDHYFPNCKFHTSLEGLGLHSVDMVVICTPSDTHCQLASLALRGGLDVLVEKPPALSVESVRILSSLAANTGRSCYTMLQWRHYHPLRRLSVLDEFELTWTTYRGDWYHKTWKGQPERSGGLFVNIGIHGLDLISRICPSAWVAEVFVGGARFQTVQFDKGRMQVSLEGKTGRTLTIDGTDISLDPARDLHLLGYHELLSGRGTRVEEAIPALALAEAINRMSQVTA